MTPDNSRSRAISRHQAGQAYPLNSCPCLAREMRDQRPANRLRKIRRTAPALVQASFACSAWKLVLDRLESKVFLNVRQRTGSAGISLRSDNSNGVRS
jgi:hypothetical protein